MFEFWLMVWLLLTVLLWREWWQWQLRRDRYHAHLQQIAQRHAWQYHRYPTHAVKYQFSGKTPEGLVWALEAVEKKHRISSTYWLTRHVKLKQGIVLIGPRPRHISAPLDFNNALLQKSLQTTLGSELARTLVGAKEVTLGSPTLQQHYVIIAQDVHTAELLLSEAVQAQLLNWIPTQSQHLLPSVVLTIQKLEVRVNTLLDEQQMHSLVSLGMLALESLANNSDVLEYDVTLEA